jgi:hypothetical protein
MARAYHTPWHPAHADDEGTAKGISVFGGVPAALRSDTDDDEDVAASDDLGAELEESEPADEEDEDEAGAGGTGEEEEEEAAPELASGSHVGFLNSGKPGLQLDPGCPLVATRDAQEAANVVRKHYRIKV